MRDPRTAMCVLVLALPVLLGGCGGDDDEPPPVAPTPTEALWNPCDAFDADDVGREFGGAVTKDDGTPTSPLCSFSPTAEGDPVVDANYQIYAAGLDKIFETLGHSETATVRSPKVRGADDARVVIDSDDHQLYVSGFVQNGDLIQTVDAIDPAPYDRDRVVRAVTWALGRLSEHARGAEIS
jgi:hypothetical protein